MHDAHSLGTNGLVSLSNILSCLSSGSSTLVAKNRSLKLVTTPTGATFPVLVHVSRFVVDAGRYPTLFR